MLSTLRVRAIQLFRGDGLRAQIMRGGLGSLLIKTFQALLAFSLVVLLARAMGPEGYGIYSYALAILMLVAIPAQVGIPQLVVRETAKAQAHNNWSLMRGLWRWANTSVILFSIVGGAAVCGILIFALQGEGSRAATVTTGIVLIPLVALANVRGASLRGLRKVVWGLLPELIIRPLILLILVSLAFFVMPEHIEMSAENVMMFHVCSAFIAFFVGMGIVFIFRPAGLRANPPPEYDSSSWRRSVVPLALISALYLINNHADFIMVGIFREDEDVGVYRAVVEMSLLVVFGLKSINSMLQPHFARLYSLGDLEKLQRLVTASARVILIIAVPAVLIFLIFGSGILGVVFGDSYRSGSDALSILAIGQLVNAATGSVGILLNMAGYENVVLKRMVFSVFVNIFLNLMFVPTWGIEGAALATTISLITWNLLLWMAVRRHLNIKSTAFFI